MAVRPQLQALLDRASSQRGRAETTLKKLKPNQLTWTPGRGHWTPAQTLDHINKVAEQTMPRFEEALRGASQPAGEEVVRYRFMDRVFLTMVGPNSPVKIPVPPIFEPEVSPNATKLVKRFFELHDAFAKLITRSDQFQLRNVRVTSPVSPKLQLGFIAYLDAMVWHEAYHMKQIEDLTADPEFPQ